MYRTAAVIIACILSGCSASEEGTQRLIEARIERDGVFVLQSQYASTDEGAATDWLRMSDTTFKQLAVLSPTPESEIVIRGDIEIVIRHAGTIFGHARINELRLVRVAGTADYFTIPAVEVERTRKVAGL